MIRVHQPEITADDALAVWSAVSSGDISGTGGPSIEEFESRFADYIGVEHAVAVSSGSTALHLAAVLARIRPGDEVLVSALTNIATANAVVQQGGVVVPIDSDPLTWNMDTDLLGDAVSSSTVAILPVHVYGNPVDMRAVMDFAGENALFVIEDAAESLGAMNDNRMTGGIGNIGCFSFYANKVVTTGEGGMLTMRSGRLAERARMLRNLAFGKPRFVHHEIGFNYRMTNMQAALGVSQMKRVDSVVAAKRDLHSRYVNRLGGIPGVEFQGEERNSLSVNWMVGIVITDECKVTRDELAQHLAEDGIETRTLFCPMSMQPSLLRDGRMRHRECPVAERLWRTGLYIPSSHTMGEQEFDFVCGKIERCLR